MVGRPLTAVSQWSGGRGNIRPARCRNTHLTCFLILIEKPEKRQKRPTEIMSKCAHNYCKSFDSMCLLALIYDTNDG